MLKKLILLSFLITQNVVGQQPEFSTSFLKLGYYGNLLINPGLSGGYEFTVGERIKTKTQAKRNRQAVKYKFNRLAVVPSFGFYADPGSNFNTFANIDFLYRRINQKGRTLAIGPGIGYVGSFVSDVYTFSQGNITENGVGVFGYVAPSVRIEIGRFKTKRDKPRGWYGALNTHFLLDYNATVLPAPAVEFGKFF